MPEPIDPASSSDPRPARLQLDRVFVLLLAPVTLASVPSLLFCALAVALRLHGFGSSTLYFHFPPQTTWDHLFALEVAACEFVSHWNSAVTLAATAVFVSTMLLPRWRSYLTLALIPYGLLLCADFTLRLR